jgi:hypothetical protein
MRQLTPHADSGAGAKTRLPHSRTRVPLIRVGGSRSPRQNTVLAGEYESGIRNKICCGLRLLGLTNSWNRDLGWRTVNSRDLLYPGFTPLFLTPVRRLRARLPLRSAPKVSGETLKAGNEGTVATTVHGFHRHSGASSFKWVMAWCNSCFGVIAKNDVECYVCGEPVDGARPARSFLFRIWATPKSPSEYLRAKDAILQRAAPGSC